MEASPDASPEKPRTAAINATTRNVITQVNIVKWFVFKNLFVTYGTKTKPTIIFYMPTVVFRLKITRRTYCNKTPISAKLAA